MKHTQAALLLAFILISLRTKAQDELLKKDGKVFTVNILHKDEHKIKFQKYQERDKRIFTMPLYKIYALRYANGQTTNPDGSLMSEEMFAYQKIAIFQHKKLNNAIALTSIGSCVSAIGITLLSIGIGNLRGPDRSSEQMLSPLAIIVGSLITIGGTPLIGVGAKRIKKAKANLRLAGPKPVTMNFNPMMIPALNQSGTLTDFAAGAGVSIHF